MRGEHRSPAIMRRINEGSSPHARGTLAVWCRRHAVGGIIPACAGNTVSSAQARQCPGDHPRMRGEHEAKPDAMRVNAGSSPHARGTPAGHAHDLQAGRIIPACAGNTGLPIGLGSKHWDHPRMRGEHQTAGSAGCPGWGSSPHARGTPGQVSAGPRDGGIIPACAGNTMKPPQ